MISQITVPKLGVVIAPLSVSAVTAKSAILPTGQGVLRVQSTVDGFIKFGDTNVTASSTTGHYMAAGSCYDFDRSEQYFAFITVSGTGTVYASELR